MGFLSLIVSGTLITLALSILVMLCNHSAFLCGKEMVLSPLYRCKDLHFHFCWRKGANGFAQPPRRQSLLELGIDGSVLRPFPITGCNITYKTFEANVFLQEGHFFSFEVVFEPSKGLQKALRRL